MLEWVSRWISDLRARVRRRGGLLLELIILRHQLLVLERAGTRRPCFRPSERLFWVFLSRCWANWQRSLIIVQPATVLRWRRPSSLTLGHSITKSTRTEFSVHTAPKSLSATLI